MLKINCNRKPSVPEGLRLKSHKKGGRVNWDPRKFKLQVFDKQSGKKIVRGEELKSEFEELDGLKKANACILDFLLENQLVIPEAWGKKDGCNRYIFFWATEYLDKKGNTCIRCIFLGPGNKWTDGYASLKDVFKKNDLALMLKAA